MMVLRTESRYEMQDMALCADPGSKIGRFAPIHDAGCEMLILYLASCAYPCLVDRMKNFRDLSTSRKKRNTTLPGVFLSLHLELLLIMELLIFST